MAFLQLGVTPPESRKQRLKRRNVFRVTAVALAFCAAPLAAYTQTLPTLAQAATALEKATDIKAQPLALLAKFPQAGPAMAQYVAQVLLRQPATFDAILSIVPDTSPEQASAIGAGLVRAVRAMGPKQSSIAEAIADKVMRSDNMWLKTTFMALGTNYRATVPLTAVANVPPRAVFVNTPVGNELPTSDWRVGPAKKGVLIPIKHHFVDKKCDLRSDIYQWRTCRGMIVAMVASDASSNGAVSTSPTH